ncbi:HWE histidine kinase domain-containing protein [Novosphingobium humi]|uniref:HWE histidine kinase domain-containing protein n=1 Tax=Novosphingobium humi TaxID=2282397 RepID=UPI0025B1B000|nr:HWE histidine kinase domain-containing protein [Novosphingobium humi]WJS98746.1 hypothetical protein NYQ05_00690 [Novosphingobium humi]
MAARTGLDPGVLSRELNHRVKNTLANVLSIIALTRRRGSDPASPALNEFADALEGASARSRPRMIC